MTRGAAEERWFSIYQSTSWHLPVRLIDDVLLLYSRGEQGSIGEMGFSINQSASWHLPVRLIDEIRLLVYSRGDQRSSRGEMVLHQSIHLMTLTCPSHRWYPPRLQQRWPEEQQRRDVPHPAGWSGGWHTAASACRYFLHKIRSNIYASSNCIAVLSVVLLFRGVASYTDKEQPRECSGHQRMIWQLWGSPCYKNTSQKAKLGCPRKTSFYQ